MNNYKYMFRRSVLLALFTFHLTCIGLSQTVVLKDTATRQPGPLEIVEIPEFAKSTMSLINEIQALVENEEKLDDILPGLNDVLIVLDRKDSLLNDTLIVYRLDDLDKEERELDLLEQRITQWKTMVQEYRETSQNEDTVLSSMNKIWLLTLDSINSSGYIVASDAEQSNNIKNEIEGILSDLQSARKELEMFQQEIQRSQTEITIAENKLGSVTNLIDSRRTVLKQNIWIPDYPAVWKVTEDTTESNVSQRLLSFIEADTNIIKAFLKNNPVLPYYFGVFILLIFGTLLYLRPRAETLYADFQEEFEKTTTILKNPFFSTLIIVWFFSAWVWYFPRELKSFLDLLMFIPAVVILHKLNPQWKWYGVLLFSFSFLLFLIIKELDYTHLGQRIFLIFLDLFTLSVLLYFRIKKVFRIYSSKFLSSTYSLIINLFLGISFISLVASVLGSIRLAQLLSYATLGVIIVLYVLKTAIHLIRSFTFLILIGPLMQHSYILQEDGRLVLGKMDRIWKFMGFIFLIYIILEMLNIREETLDAISTIISYPLTVGEMSVSIARILAFFITIQFAIWLSTFIRYVLEKEVFPRTQLKQGVPNTILLMVKFSITLLGILFAFSAAGIKTDKLAIAMGALGVGIGFGLQNIISNFISGIILALERPISIGDIIEIPEVNGVVKNIGIRASTVRTWDGSDVIVPNADLISNKLTNWTFYDRLRRVKVDIRVPFDTDIKQVSELLLKISRNVHEVMKEPEPYLNFKGIGTSAMEITLYCWINDTNKIFSYGTIIREAVYKGLKDAGYDTPVPRQELKIDSEQKNSGMKYPE